MIENADKLKGDIPGGSAAAGVRLGVKLRLEYLANVLKIYINIRKSVPKTIIRQSCLLATICSALSVYTLSQTK